MRDCVIETWDPNEGPSFPKQFTFDSVYDQDATTETIYNEICYPLIEVRIKKNYKWLFLIEIGVFRALWKAIIVQSLFMDKLVVGNRLQWRVV